MSSKELYKKKFEELLVAEEKARDFYKYYMGNVKDLRISEKLKLIYGDECKHVEIAKKFIDILS